VPAAGIYYQLRSPVKLAVGVGDAGFKGRAFAPHEGGRKLLADGEALDEVIRTSFGFAAGYVRGIVEGKFPLTPPERISTACSYCSYRACCGIQLVRRVAPTPMEAS
jgi:hypothetical protein